MEADLTIEIDAPPETVFHWITDPDCVTRWLAHLSHFELVDATEPAAGIKFKQTWDDEENSELLGEITACQINERYSIHLNGKGFDAEIEYRLSDIDGRTRLRQKTTFEYKGIMKMIEKVAGGKIRKSYEDEAKRNLANLIEFCETATQE